MTTTLETSQTRLATWRSVVEWLQNILTRDPEHAGIESFICGKGVASFTTAKQTHGADAYFDGEGIVQSFMDELSQEDKEAYAARRVLSLRVLVPEIGILRCFLIRSANRDILQVRVLSNDPEEASAFEFSPTLQSLLASRSGILIVGGPKGSGTTSAYGAMMRTAVANHSDDLIVTIGSPVVHDFQYGHGQVLPINIGIRQDVTRYRDAIRQASDMHARVIGIDGGIGEYEAFAEAVKAAESGALVIATFRTRSAVHGIQSIYTNIPAAVREHVWSSFVHEFLGMIALDLVPSRYTGHVNQAPDMILASPRVVPMLMNLDEQALRKYQNDRTADSCFRDNVLADLVTRSEIDGKTAMQYSIEKDALRSRISGAL